MTKRRILFIEIKNSLRLNLCQHLRQEGYAVHVAEREKEVMDVLSHSSVKVAILGLEGLKIEGLALLRMLRKQYPAVKVITINSPDRFDLSLECMRLGAFDDFLIPFDLDTLMASLKEAFSAPLQGVSPRKTQRNKIYPTRPGKGGEE
jgi:DNA-binding NtrC family response regulator